VALQNVFGDLGLDATLQAIRDRIGDVAASPTANTVQDRLKALKASVDTIEAGQLTTADIAALAKDSTLSGVKTGTDRIPASPAQEHVTAASPHATRLSDGSAYLSTTSGRLQVADGGVSLGVAAPVGTPVAVRLSDGAAFIDPRDTSDRAGRLLGHVTVDNSVLHIDDNAGSLTVDGTLTVIGNKAEDAAAADGDSGLPVLGVRNDAAAAKTSADGDYGMLALDSAGRLGIADLGGSVTIDGTVTANQGGAWTVAVSGTVDVSDRDARLLGRVKLLDSGGNVIDPAKDGTLTGGTAKAIARGGAKGATTAADVTSTAEGADHQALDTQAYHGGAAIDPRDVSDRAARQLGVVDTELPAAVLAADNISLPTAPEVLAALQGYDGTNLDLIRTAPSSDPGNLTGYLAVANLLYSGASTLIRQSDVSRAASDAQTGALAAIGVYDYDGSTNWNRRRNNNTQTALASSARTGTTSSADIVTYNAKTAQAILSLTAFTTAASLVLTIEGKDAISGSYYALNASPAAVTATGLYVYEIGPGGTASGGVTQRTAGVLPRTIRVTVTHATANSHTYSVSLMLGV
jgi:hypothetical protein